MIWCRLLNILADKRKLGTLRINRKIKKIKTVPENKCPPEVGLHVAGKKLQDVTTGLPMRGDDLEQIL